MAGQRPLQIGRYVLHDEIASGGMASVHFGRLVGTGGFSKTVAIKRLHRLFARQPSFRKMILEEGRLAARIRHPNVVPPLDILAEGNELLLVMEYVHGESLSRLNKAAVAAGELLPVAIVAAILSNVLHGLHAAHEAKDENGVPLGIVHRDMSPQNVIVGVDGVARVIDFGIAKAVDSDEHTQTGTIKGKVPYLAPEQLDGMQATRRTDVYAAAVCFWEALVGKRLFSGADEGEVLRAILQMEIPPPSSLNPAVPGAIDDVVLRGLARAPDARFATAREMAMEIEAAVHLATSTQVGATVERLAAEALAERARMLEEVERSINVDVEDLPTETLPRSSKEMPAAKTLSTEIPSVATDSPKTVGAPEAHMVAAPVPTLVAPAPPPAPPRPHGHPPSFSPHEAAVAVPPPPPTRPMGSLPRTPAAPMSPMDSLQRPTPNAPLAPVGPIAPIAAMPDTLRPPAAGVLRKPEVEIPNVAWLPPPSAAETALVPRAEAPQSGARFVPWALGIVFLLVAAAWILAPFAIQRLLVSAAEKRGIVLSIDRVEVSRRAVRLVDVKAETVELPGVSVHAAAIVLGHRQLALTSASIDDVEISLDGAWPDLGARFAKWRALRGADLKSTFAGYQQIAVTSGRLEWKNLAGADTSLLLENLAGDMSKNSPRLFGDDWRFSAPLVTFKMGALSAGPWAVDGDRTGMADRVIVRFDPSGTYPASVTWTSSDDGSDTVDFAIPPTRLSEMHLPAAFLGALPSDRTRLEARGALSVVTAQGSRTAGGRLTLAAGALGLFQGAEKVDVALDLPVSGDSAAPIQITTANLAIAPSDPTGAPSAPAASARLVGQLDLRGNGARLEIAGKTNAVPCAKVPGQTSVVTVIAVPLHDLRKAQISLTPSNVCVPRLR